MLRGRASLLAVFVFLWSSLWPEFAKAEGPTSLCRDVDAKSLALLKTSIPEGFGADVDTVLTLTWEVDQDLNIPLSFIEKEADEPFKVSGAEQTLEDLLRAVIDQHDHYRCEVYDGRLVLRSSDPIYDAMISDVEVSEEYRYPAKRAYIDHLRASGPRFAEWHDDVLYTYSTGDPRFEGRVTLSPRATLVQHLVQLLGRDRALFFRVPAPSQYGPGRAISFGAVYRRY